MILKNLTRKTNSYGQLIGYIFKDGATLKQKNGKPFEFRHNLLKGSPKDYENAFKENELNKIKRKGGVTMHHTIISWHKNDAQKLDIKTIEAIAKRYVELRGANAIYLSGVHQDREHVHLHTIQSASEVYSKKSTRISKAELKIIKEKLQEYELEKFNLIHSKVDHGKGQGKNDREYQLEARTGKSRKEEIRNILSQCYENSLSKENFIERVRESGLELYERGGQIAGIADDRHMRFTTLGYTDEKFERLSVREERQEEINSIRKEKTEQLELKQGQLDTLNMAREELKIEKESDNKGDEKINDNVKQVGFERQ
jgi:hypothetical protein